MDKINKIHKIWVAGITKNGKNYLFKFDGFSGPQPST